MQMGPAWTDRAGAPRGPCQPHLTMSMQRWEILAPHGSGALTDVRGPRQSQTAEGRGPSTLEPGSCRLQGRRAGPSFMLKGSSPRPLAGPALLTQPVMLGWVAACRTPSAPPSGTVHSACFPSRSGIPSTGPVLSEQAVGCRATLSDVCAEVQGAVAGEGEPGIGDPSSPPNFRPC